MAAGKKTGGREAGTPNKTTKALKDAILGAFDDAGGQAYLARIATDDPKTFCALLGKVLPMQVTGGGEGEPPVNVVVRFIKPGQAPPEV